MLRILACALCVSFGCAAEPSANVSQDEAASESAIESVSATPATNFCLHPTSCIQLCSCDKQECIAGGGSPQQCGAEQTGCIADCPRGGGGIIPIP